MRPAAAGDESGLGGVQRPPGAVLQLCIHPRLCQEGRASGELVGGLPGNERPDHSPKSLPLLPQMLACGRWNPCLPSVRAEDTAPPTRPQRLSPGTLSLEWEEEKAEKR